MTEKNQAEQPDPKWAQQFEQSLNKALDGLATKLVNAKVVIQQDSIPEHPTTEDEIRAYNRATGRDFYRVDESGKIVEPEIKYRFASWFPCWTSDATVTSAFLARANIEKWKAKPETTERIDRLKVEGEQREIVSQFFMDCRDFFRKFTPTTRSILDHQERRETCPAISRPTA